LYTFKKETSWQLLQSDFINNRRKKHVLQKLLNFALVIVIPGFLILGAWNILNPGDFFKRIFSKNVSTIEQTQKQTQEKILLSKTKVKQLIQNISFLNADKNVFFVDNLENSYTITSSLDTDLQKDLLSAMDRLKTLDRGKPQRIAIIAMDATNGAIVAMAGFDLDNPGANPCLESNYPAASIFKIVTAAAAVDSLGYTAHTPMYFNGNKYTLYKRQLKEVKNKYTTKISLANAFAESVNPVFGKIGKNYLGKEKLNNYALAFGFNKNPESELEFESSRFNIKENDFHLAELGCGFNRDTMISPIFGAMLITTVLNSGTSLIPSIVNQVKTAQGEIIYKSKKEIYKSAMTPKTAETMIRLMEKTITNGTAKKSFRRFSKDKTLSKLIIGGKTGSLFNRERTVKYDWFTGFGKEKTGDRALAVSIVVGHRKYIGTRASAYGKTILKKYFKEKPVATARIE